MLLICGAQHYYDKGCHMHCLNSLSCVMLCRYGKEALEYMEQGRHEGWEPNSDLYELVVGWYCSQVCPAPSSARAPALRQFGQRSLDAMSFPALRCAALCMRQLCWFCSALLHEKGLAYSAPCVSRTKEMSHDTFTVLPP